MPQAKLELGGPGLQPRGQIPCTQRTTPPLSFQGNPRELMSEDYTRIRALGHSFWGRNSSLFPARSTVMHRALDAVIAPDTAWLLHLRSILQVKATCKSDT